MVSTIDLDGDGDPDIAISNLGLDSISVLMNVGDGTYAPPEMYQAGDAAGDNSSGDLDSDGDIDLVNVNYWSNDVSVFLNIGDGGQFNYSEFEVGQNPAEVSIADLNGDGALDVVTANEGSNDVSVLLNVRVSPEVHTLLVDGSDPALNVVNHTPLIEWSYTDPLEPRVQTQAEIAVGTDDDWQ